MRLTKLLFLLFFTATLTKLAYSQGGSVKNGVMQIDASNLDHIVYLDGQWHFFWNTTYQSFQQYKPQLIPELIKVPGDWTMLNYPDKGYGFYTLKLIIKDVQPQRLSLRVPVICTNYNLYIDDQLVKSVGNFSAFESTNKPEYRKDFISFIPQSDTINIAFEVANYNYRAGGIDYSIGIGTEEKVAFRFNFDMISEGFMIGALLLMCIYFFSFYFIRRNDLTTIYFAFLCLVSAFRIASTGQIIIRQIHLPISWEWLYRVEFISIILIPAFGGLYLFKLLNQSKFFVVMRFLNFINIVLCLVVIFSSSYHSSFIIPVFKYYALGELIFLLFIVARLIVINNDRLAMYAGVGYVFVFIFGINDVLFSRGDINTMFLLPVGILVYVFIQAIVLTQKFSQSFKDVELLSDKLQLVNKTQEEIIDKRTAELQNYNSIKDKIFTIIGHDLRAPIATLSSVLNLAEQADDKTLSELRVYFKGIKRSVDNLNLTIENLLLWSQSQINGIEINPTEIDLNKKVESAISLYSLVALQKEITLIHNFKEQFIVKADQAHLNLILRNVISNSLKFTNIAGSIIITATREEGNSVKICISDNGTGIQPEKLSKIFNPQEHFTTYGTLNEKGTGLGLLLCKEYVEKNGGMITVESTLGIGTKVCITLPLA